MKKTLLFAVLALLPFANKAQVEIQIQSVSPQPVCAGDTMTVCFTHNYVGYYDPTILHPFTITLDGKDTTIYYTIPDYSLVNTLPICDPSTNSKEVKFQVPYSVAAGNYHVQAEPGTEMDLSVISCTVDPTLKKCRDPFYLDTICMGDSVELDFKYNAGSPSVFNFTFNVLWIENYNTPNPIITHTLSNHPGSYLIFAPLTPGLVNCRSRKFHIPCLRSNVNINDAYMIQLEGPWDESIDNRFLCRLINCENCTDYLGVSEYELNKLSPVYFDIYGNKTNPVPNTLLIEQKGTIRKKVVIVSN